MSRSQVVQMETIGSAAGLLKEGMALAKCRKCQCMKDALDNICNALRSPRMVALAPLRSRAEAWLKEMQPVEYE